MNARIENHLSSRTLEARAAADDEVLAFWSKALAAYNDSRNASASLDNRLLRAYDAARLAAVALVRSAGYRPRGAEGHHHVTFDVARSVASGDLAQSLLAADELRSLRHTVQYEPEDEANADAVATAIDTAKQVINLGAKHLRAERPSLGKRLHMVEP